MFLRRTPRDNLIGPSAQLSSIQALTIAYGKLTTHFNNRHYHPSYRINEGLTTSNNDPTNELRRELLEELDDLGASKKHLENLRSDVVQVRTNQSLSNIQMSDSRLLVGLINHDQTTAQQDQKEIGRNIHVDQSITNVSAVSGSRGVIGTAENIDIGLFFGTR